jgi:hypothetical protein
MIYSMQQVPMTHRYEVTSPDLLQGSRCYVDASTEPDHPSLHSRTAGLGVFILNFQEQTPKAIHIKAKLQECTSVIMAEAASLALAAAIINNLNLTEVNYLSDCEQLVHFLNKDDLSNPPDWRIKHFTQLFSNHSAEGSTKLYKVHRRLNITAHTLARQAAQDPYIQNDHFQFSCSFDHHVNQCGLLQALQAVSITDVTITAARCC